MDIAEVKDDHIALNIKEGVSLRLTPKDVYLILIVGKLLGSTKMLPMGNA